MTALKLEEWFKSEGEKIAVQAYIDRQIFCLGNEFQKLYAAKNECWFENVVNLHTPIETCKHEYFDYVKENLSDSFSDLKDALREWVENEGDDNYSPYDNYYNEYIEHLRDQQEMQDVMQWFIVSDWLASKLIEIGEPVLSTDNHTLWGRTCYGQSLELDGTLQKVYRLTQKD